MSEKQYKSLQAYSVKADSDKGIVEAIVSVFGNVDSYGEIVEHGAFTSSLSKKLPIGVWMHYWDQPVAKTLEAAELAPGDTRLPESIRALGGLYIKGQFNLETQRGREAFSDIKEGIIDEFSIGYRTIKSERNEETGIITLKEVELYEWSPVVRGANPATALIGAKDDTRVLSRTLKQQITALKDEADDLLERLSDLKEDREGRKKWISDESREYATTTLRGLEVAVESLKSLLADEKSEDDNEADARREFLSMRGAFERGRVRRRRLLTA